MYVANGNSAEIVRDAFLAAELGESETFIAALVIADRIRTWLQESRVISFDGTDRALRALTMKMGGTPPGGSLRLALKHLVAQGRIEPSKDREKWYDVIHRDCCPART
jgi:hypothetical protein